MINRQFLDRFFKQVSLQFVVLVPFLLLTFTAVAVVGYISFRSGQADVNDVADKLRSEINYRISEHLSSFFAVPSRINQTNAGSMARGTLDHRDQEALMRHFWDQVAIFDTITSISFGNTDGGLANAGREGAEDLLYYIYTDNFVSGTFYKYASDDEGFKTELLDVVPSFDGRTRSWYIDALEKGINTWSDPYVLFTGQDMNISLSRPVYDGDGELLGVVAVNLFLSHLVDFLSSLSVGQNGQSFILERSGNLIATSFGTELFKPSGSGDGFDRIVAMQSEDLFIATAVETLLQRYGNLDAVEAMSEFEFSYDDERQMAQVMPFQDPGGLDWLIITTIPESDFIAQIEVNRRSTIILMLVTLAVVTLVSFFITSRILIPIDHLNRSALALAKGKWVQTMKTDSRIKEVGLLSQSFNSMAKQLRQIVKRLTDEVYDRKKAEEEIRTLNEELEERVRERTAQLEEVNRELDAFTYSASHDLRGPLNRISGFSEALLEEYPEQLDQQGKDYLQRINNSCKNMGALIDDLLKLSKVSQHQINHDTVELSALANIYLKELHAREPDRQVETVVAPGLVAEADAALMGIALKNLLTNAWKFSAFENPARIEFGSTVQEGNEVFYIRDNGIGFDMKYAEKLFTAFQRLHDAKTYPGTGIGLSIVSRIISRHGGEIWAEGEEGKGSCFCFTLP